MMSISQEFCSDYFRLLMQIHDELLLEVLDSDLDLVTGKPLYLYELCHEKTCLKPMQPKRCTIRQSDLESTMSQISLSEACFCC